MQRRMRKGNRAGALGELALPVAVGCPIESYKGPHSRAAQEREDKIPPTWIVQVARAIRQVLLHDFPERRKLELQCQRSSVLLAMVLRKQRIDIRVISGHVRGDRPAQEADTGHLWCRILHPEEGCWYLLDLSLAQFDFLFERPVPDIVWGKYWNCLREFGYVEDDPAEWEYDPREVDPQRIQAVRSLLP